jgi:hypothetical protein
MAKYLVKASYTAEGVKGLVRSSGSARRQAVEKTIRLFILPLARPMLM